MQVSYRRFEPLVIEYKRDKMVVDENEGLYFTIKDAQNFMKVASGLITMALMNINVYADAAYVMSKVNATGFEVYGITKGICYWGAIVLMVIDIIKSMKKEDISGIIRICVKYSGIYACIYFAPDIIMLIVNLFK